MCNFLDRLTPEDLTESEKQYNEHYGEMDMALWRLSQRCRTPLIEGHSSEVINVLVRTIMKWWGVPDFKGTKPLMAKALSSMPWSEEIFAEDPELTPQNAEWASDRVGTLVRRSIELGVPSREVSLASKVLHWLLPWRVPVYDGNVRKVLKLPERDKEKRLQTYYDLSLKIFQCIGKMSSQGQKLPNPVGPPSPLRALDKCLWWHGGGKGGKAWIVPNPMEEIEAMIKAFKGCHQVVLG